MKAATRVIMVLIVTTVVFASGATAQQPSKVFQAMARAGIYSPRSELSGYSLDENRLRNRKQRSSFAVSFAAEMRLPVPYLSVRGNVEYVPSLDVGEGLCSPGGLCAFVALPDTKAHLVVVSADLVLRPRFGSVLAPYVLGGVGVRDYSGALESTDFTLHLGIGVGFELTDAVYPVLELSDYISEFNGFDVPQESPTQHDVTLTAGLRFGVF